MPDDPRTGGLATRRRSGSRFTLGGPQGFPADFRNLGDDDHVGSKKSVARADDRPGRTRVFAGVFVQVELSGLSYRIAESLTP